MQRALFPMEYLRVTQNENGSTSHKGSLAMDLGGRNTGVDKVYGPCDMRIVRVRKDSSHETYAESLEPVLWADGTVDYLNFTFMHDNVLNANCKAGSIIRQGQPSRRKASPLYYIYVTLFTMACHTGVAQFVSAQSLGYLACNVMDRNFWLVLLRWLALCQCVSYLT